MLRSLRLLLVVAYTLLGACEAAPGPGEMGSLDISSEEIASILQRHNRRVDLLQRLYATGVMEYRWVDDQGRSHFEPQINSRIWLDLPRHSAVEGEKIERLFWLGSDDEQYWIFDLINEPTTLYVGRHEVALGRDAPLLVPPLSLIDLMGLTPLPIPRHDEMIEDAALEFSSDTFAVQVEGAGGAMKATFSAAGDLIAVETIGADGEVLLRSELKDPQSVYVPGVARSALPRLARDIRISDPQRTLEVFLALGEVSTGEGQPWERVFDLDRLTRHSRPARVERMRADLDGGGSGGLEVK